MNLMQSAFLLSADAQEILTLLYRQHKITESIQINFISAKAGLPPPAFAQTIRRLEELGMLHYEKYGRITLTAEGVRYAKRLQQTLL